MLTFCKPSSWACTLLCKALMPRHRVGILFAGYATLAIPSNLVISWVGAKTWLPVLTTAWGLIAAAQAAVKGEKAIIALRFLLGAAEAGDCPPPASSSVCKAYLRSVLKHANKHTQSALVVVHQ